MAEFISLAGLLALFFGYVLGSIPFGLVLTKLAGMGDVRAIGSGNIGATNVLRTGKKGLAAATLLLDMLKGTVAVAAVLYAGNSAGGTAGGTAGLPAAKAAYMAGFGAFMGHLYPLWLGFKGGKGVATYIGVLLGLLPGAAILFCAVWLLVAALSRYSSAAALVATMAVPVYYLVLGQFGIGFILIMSALIFYKHRDNIRRLLAGEETKIGA